MDDAITDVTGIEVGHADDPVVLTGCTVVLCRDGAVVGVDVRGLAPGTRETDLCRPGTLVEQAQAILLTGGSAFGLDAAGGVVRYLHERGLGFDSGVIPVPIVPAAVVFDLGIGSPVWPDAAMGYRACTRASDAPPAQGTVGAGMGATVGKSRGPLRSVKSGIGTASVRVGAATVGALVVVNAIGDVLAEDGSVLAGAREGRDNEVTEKPVAGTNTTIGVVATDALLTADNVHHLASISHDGLARAIQPVHTLYDGDTIFALSTGTGPPEDVFRLATAAPIVVARAIRNAVRHATPAGGVPSATLTP